MKINKFMIGISLLPTSTIIPSLLITSCSQDGLVKHECVLENSYVTFKAWFSKNVKSVETTSGIKFYIYGNQITHQVNFGYMQETATITFSVITIDDSVWSFRLDVNKNTQYQLTKIK